jgi:hypothetical protein
MITVTITNVAFSNANGFFVLLKESGGERTLPIFVGPLEARSIASVLGGEKFARPMTHDLFKNVLDMLGCTLLRVEVCDLANDTFYGKLIVRCSDERLLEIDSRPSDAIALALRCHAPVLVAEKVMEEASMMIDLQLMQGQEQEKAPEKPEKTVVPKTKLEELKAALEKAITEEKYEECARLRDEIEKLSKKTDAN